MSFHYCDFCETNHSAMSCFHPGYAKFAEMKHRAEQAEGRVGELEAK